MISCYTDATRGRGIRSHMVAADRVAEAEARESARFAMTREAREAMERMEEARRRSEARTPEEREADLRTACSGALDDLAWFCRIRQKAARWEGLTLEGRVAMVAHTMADMGACTRQAARTVTGQAEAGDLAGAVRGLERLRRAARGW